MQGDAAGRRDRRRAWPPHQVGHRRHRPRGPQDVEERVDMAHRLRAGAVDRHPHGRVVAEQGGTDGSDRDRRRPHRRQHRAVEQRDGGESGGVEEQVDALDAR